jgi:hypothetical protein
VMRSVKLAKCVARTAMVSLRDYSSCRRQSLLAIVRSGCYETYIPNDTAFVGRKAPLF